MLATLLGHSGRVDCVRWLPGHTEGRRAPMHVCMPVVWEREFNAMMLTGPETVMPPRKLRMRPCRGCQGSGVGRRRRHHHRLALVPQ